MVIATFLVLRARGLEFVGGILIGLKGSQVGTN